MSKKEFKYKTTFASILKVPLSEQEDSFIAKASLSSLKDFLPKDFDSTRDWDLLPFSAVSYVSNFVNLNGDAIKNDLAIATAPTFVNRGVDLEHDLLDKKGCITTFGFTQFNSDYKTSVVGKSLTLEEAKQSKEPINVIVGGYLWTIANDDLMAKIIDSNNPDSKNYLSIALSFEIGFSEYQIALCKSRDLSDAQYITEASEISKLEPYLKSNGGTGKKDNLIIARILTNEVTPIGVAITSAPAAPVAGIFVQANSKSKLTCSNCNKEMEYDSEDMDEDEMMECANCKSKIDKSGKVMANTENLSVKNIDNDYKQYFDFRMRLAEINKKL